MDQEKISALEAIERIKSICQSLRPEVVWSISEAGFVINKDDLFKEFTLTISVQADDAQLPGPRG